LVQQTGANNEPKPWLSTGIFGKVVDLTSRNKAPVIQPPPVYATTTAPVVTTTVKSDLRPNTTVSNPSSADQQLIQIWKQASKTERQKFMTWLAEQ